MYLPRDIGIAIDFKMNNHVLFRKSISGLLYISLQALIYYKLISYDYNLIIIILIFVYLILYRCTLIILYVLFAVRNPPPICARVPFIWKTKACIQLYNNRLIHKHYYTCARIIIKALGIKVVNKKLACFKIAI